MRILALETSSKQTSVALQEAGRLLSQKSLDSEQRVAQSLLPTIAREVAGVGWKLNDVQLVTVAQGPGSFTGLRVGITTAKTLAYALQIPIIGVNTLEAIAFQAFYPLSDDDHGPFADLERPLAVVMNAHRGQFFAARFASAQLRRCQTIQSTHLVAQQQWPEQLDPGMSVSGPGLSLVEPFLPPTVTVVEPARHFPRAAAVAQLAQQIWSAEQVPVTDLNQQIFSLRPEYYRRSAAEEKRETR